MTSFYALCRSRRVRTGRRLAWVRTRVPASWRVSQRALYAPGRPVGSSVPRSYALSVLVIALSACLQVSVRLRDHSNVKTLSNIRTQKADHEFVDAWRRAAGRARTPAIISVTLLPLPRRCNLNHCYTAQH
jgi:hypothetical protein